MALVSITSGPLVHFSIRCHSGSSLPQNAFACWWKTCLLDYHLLAVFVLISV